jgi:hypothetical protein
MDSGELKFDLYQGKYLANVRKNRVIKMEELGLRKLTENVYINFSQDEEYLILGN